jgi:hypothetical protein
MSKIFIAHRANISGPNPSRENQPTYISEALNLGYHVEIDVWLSGNNFYLGHDRPEYVISKEFLLTPNLWLHCKNIQALDALILEPEINCFAHDKDDYVLTSLAYIWCFPNFKTRLTSNSIAVLPERVPGWRLDGCAGICSDRIEEYRLMYSSNNVGLKHVEIVVK